MKVKRTQLIRTWQDGVAPEKETKPETLKDFVGLHREWMLTMNYSASTIKSRERMLWRFTEWCEDRGTSRLDQVTGALVERYPKHMYQSKDERTGKRRSAGAQCGHLMAVREFFRWCYKKKHLPFNPAAEIELPRQEKRLPRNVLTPEQVEKVLAVIDIETPEGLRDRTILETFYSTGIRREELANLYVSDVQPNPGTLLIRLGKGKKDRFVPIGERAMAWIEKYLNEARPQLVKGRDPDALFLTSLGEGCKPDTLSGWMHKYIEKSGVSDKGACHIFRHAMATTMLDHGADLRFIQKMLGHSDIGSTQIYTHVSLQKLREVHEATHPASKIARPKKQKKKKAE